MNRHTINTITFGSTLVSCFGSASATLAGGGDAPGTGPVITGAQIIAGPVAIVGDTSDNTDQFDIGGTMGLPNGCEASPGPDAWYRIEIGATTGTLDIDIDLCGGGGTLYDTLIYVLDTADNVRSCNDFSVCTTPDSGPSKIIALHLEPGTYRLAIDGDDDDDAGVYVGEVRLFEPHECNLEFIPSCGAALEGEICDEAVPDNFNAGCNSTPEAFSQVELRRSAYGTLWAHNGVRDTDWWSFNVTAQEVYRLDIWAEVDAVVFIAEMSPGGVCPVIGIPAGNVAFSGDCDTIHTTSFEHMHVLDPGDYIMFVGAGHPDGSGIFDGFPCPDGTTTNNAYRVRISECPITLPAPACPWDIVGASCPGAAVGFEDVLAVVAHWGPCPEPPAPCPWDLDWNGTINFQDILQVIANWGPCVETLCSCLCAQGADE